MAKRPNLNNVSNILNGEATINTNWELIGAAFDNTLSLDGSTPNQLNADLDLNQNDVLNGGIGNFSEVRVAGFPLVPKSATALFIPDWEGAWVTATDYVVNDLVQESGNTYICLVDHTSGTFSTDLSSNYWELFASKGASGAGSGDLVSTNNLSDLGNADTALTNLGGGTAGIAVFKDTTAAAIQAQLDLEPGVDVQEQNAYLQDLADLTASEGDLIYFDGTDFVNLGVGTAGQNLVVNSGATAPEWADAPTSSGFSLIEERTLTTNSIEDFTIPAGYREIVFYFENVRSFISGVPFEIRLSDDGGSSFESSRNFAGNDATTQAIGAMGNGTPMNGKASLVGYTSGAATLMSHTFSVASASAGAVGPYGVEEIVGQTTGGTINLVRFLTVGDLRNGSISMYGIT